MRLRLLRPPAKTNRIFVVERGGNIVVITILPHQRAPSLNITQGDLRQRRGGLLPGFHPGYATTVFYVWYYGFDPPRQAVARTIFWRAPGLLHHGNFADPPTR